MDFMSDSQDAQDERAEKTGRPVTVGGSKKSIYISTADWEYLKAISPTGTASAGIRELIRDAKNPTSRPVIGIVGKNAG